MATNWTSVFNDALNAAKTSLGANWPNPDAHVVFQIQQIVNLAQFLQNDQDQMEPDEYSDAVTAQKSLLTNIIKGYEGIAVAQATNAVDAVINAILTDVPALAEAWV